MTRTCVAMILSLAVGSALGGEAEGPIFTKTPTATRAADGTVTIEFTVDRATDVAVSVEDVQGTIVRHLVAGQLGRNAPAPLRPDALGQSLVWDGRDDDGRPVPPGRYRVRVGLGLTATPAGFLGENRNGLGRVYGLAAGSDGRLYVMNDGGSGCINIHCFEGGKSRMVVPRPAGLPLERVLPLGEVVLDGGERIPREFLPQFGVGLRQAPAVAPQGDLVFANGGSLAEHAHTETKRFGSQELRTPWPRRLLRLASDGGASDLGYLGPLLGKGFEGPTLYLAVADDNRTVYVSGARHAVFRVTWGKDEEPVAFVGVPDQPGAGEKGLNDPCGIALDGRGNLYVADRGNHRIACFDPKGQLVGQIALLWPSQVAVHPRTGAVYATCGHTSWRVVKFEGLTAAQPSAELSVRSAWPGLALDASGRTPVVYLSNVNRRDSSGGRDWQAVIRLTDGGGGFVEAGNLSGPGSWLTPLLLGVDRRNEQVYVMTGSGYGYVRFHGGDGRRETVRSPLFPGGNGVSELTAGADGTVAVHAQGYFGRLDGGLSPLPFAVSGTHLVSLSGDDCPKSFFDRGSCVGPDGAIYWVHYRGGSRNPMLVGALNADGSVKADTLISLDSRAAAGVRVDRQGCVYVAEHLKPVGQPVPEALRGKVSEARHDRFVYNYGSLLKFGPTGGVVRQRSKSAPEQRDLAVGQMQFTTAEGRGDFVVEGALWSYYGVSMIAPALDRGNYCVCFAPRFDLDDFARAFVPDALRCRVAVLDKNGNELLTFGRYGNADDRGPGVVLADPRSVMVSDRAAYVGDMTNGRIARVALGYRREWWSEVTLGGPEPALPAVVAEVRAEAVAVSPGLKQALDWSRLSSGGGADGVRAALCLAARDVAGAEALFDSYLDSPSETVRLAAAWGLWTRTGVPAGRQALLKALGDRADKVRLVAAAALLNAGDTAGLAEVFRAARSSDRDVFKLAETAVLKDVLVWDDTHPKAGLIDPNDCRVPQFPMGAPEIEALAALLDSAYTKDAADGEEAPLWTARRAVIFLLALSDRPEAVPPLLAAMRHPETRRDDQGRNRNRLIGALGALRCREAVPDILVYLARGKGSAYAREWGDRAEQFAARALQRIAAPESVEPLIALLDSSTPGVADSALDVLTRIFRTDVPDGFRLMPRDGELEAVRIPDLPDPKGRRAAWEAFWTKAQGRYSWNPSGPPLITGQ